MTRCQPTTSSKPNWKRSIKNVSLDDGTKKELVSAKAEIEELFKGLLG